MAITWPSWPEQGPQNCVTHCPALRLGPSLPLQDCVQPGLGLKGAALAEAQALYSPPHTSPPHPVSLQAFPPAPLGHPTHTPVLQPGQTALRLRSVPVLARAVPAAYNPHSLLGKPLQHPPRHNANGTSSLKLFLLFLNCPDCGLRHSLINYSGMLRQPLPQPTPAQSITGKAFSNTISHSPLHSNSVSPGLYPGRQFSAPFSLSQEPWAQQLWSRLNLSAAHGILRGQEPITTALKLLILLHLEY